MKQKIDFLWLGITGRYGIWKDGLWAAMKILEETYDIEYKEPTAEIREDAIVLYWEAPCCINGPDKDSYNRVHNLPNRKVLLFAGGPLQQDWVYGFDHVCVESQINADECEAQGIPHSTAFGVNTDIWKPVPSVFSRHWDGIHHGTCASWKRQWLVGEAVGDRGILVGRYQESDPYPFDRARELGVTVMDETDPESLVHYMTASRTCLQTSDYWGGGQRCTLEAMAAGVPVICMSDSPKNREYVEESGFGLVVDPEPTQIRNAVEKLKAEPLDPMIGVDYVNSKWSHRHYAENLIKAIESL